MAILLPVPESEQRVLDNLLRDLNETYPDKIIVGLQKDHKKWYEKVTRLYKNIGYASRDEFLAAYGFTEEKGKGGRPSIDLNAIVDELISRYEGDRFVTSIDQLKEENPDLAPKFKSLQNKAKDLFGMSLNNYLKEKGVFQSDKSAAEDKAKEYQVKLEIIFDELKKRYEGKELPKSISELKESNSDIEDITNIGPWIERAYNRHGLEYLVELGLIQEKEKKPEKTAEQIAASNIRKLPVDQKLAFITESLREKVSVNGKSESFKEMCEQYDDLPNESTIRKWTKEVFGLSPNDYFVDAGIVMSPHEQYMAFLDQMLHDEFNPSESVKRESFYDYYDFFDTDALLMETIGSTDESILPKNKKQSVTIGDHTFTVKNKMGTGLKRFEMPYSAFYFDLNVAYDNILEVEDVQQRMLHVEDTSDAWVYAKPIVDPDAVTISKETAEKRYRLFTALTHLISREDVLENICKLAPKKKNGTFHKGRVMRIATTATVEAAGHDKTNILYSDHAIWAILAKAEADDELSVYVEQRRISDSELELIKRDFISSQWKALGLEKYVNKTGQVVIKRDREELFRVEGDRLFINNAEGKEDFLNDFTAYRSAVVDGDEIKVLFPYQDNFTRSFRGVDFTVDVEKMHGPILDAWSCMLAFGGLYDYKDWSKRSQKASRRVHHYDDGCTVIDHVPGSNTPGNPYSDCRVLKVKKYGLKESIIRFARFIDAITDICEQLIDSAPREKSGLLKKGEYASFSLQYVLEKEFYVFPPKDMLYGHMFTADESTIALELRFWKKYWNVPG